MDFKDLNAEKRRQLINTQQVYEGWRATHRDARHRFAGSMRWVHRNHNGTYLYRKIAQSEKSLGPRDSKTQAIYDAFCKGRTGNKDRLDGLINRLDELAKINQAMGLGRVPSVASRILQHCDENDLLGEQLVVVGTNVLFAYEVLAGLHVESDLVATDDIDLLYDARRHMSFLVTKEIHSKGFIGLLRNVDRSFTPLRPRGFRASNRDGYLVDLIRPEAKDVFKDRLSPALTDLADDLEGAAIFGLGWLINSPKMEAIVIDERGYPVRMAVIDPRAFALHKAWLSSKDDRDALKRKRDFEQAKAAAVIATQYLQLPFDDTQALAALPKQLRNLAPEILK
jgi:hypothetical protein